MWGQSLDAEKDTKPHTATERESAPGTEDSGSPSHPPAVFEGKPLFRALLSAVSCWRDTPPRSTEESS